MIPTDFTFDDDGRTYQAVRQPNEHQIDLGSPGLGFWQAIHDGTVFAQVEYLARETRPALVARLRRELPRPIR